MQARKSLADAAFMNQQGRGSDTSNREGKDACLARLGAVNTQASIDDRYPASPGMIQELMINIIKEHRKCCTNARASGSHGLMPCKTEEHTLEQYILL